LGSLGWLFFGPGNNAYVLTHASKDNVGKFLSIKDTFESMGVVISSAFLIVTLSISVQSVAILILSFLLLSIIIISKAPKDIENVNKEKKISTHNYYIKRVYLNRVIKAIFKLNPASLILIITSLSASTFYAIIWFVVPLIIADHKNDMIMGLSLGSFDLGIMLTGFLIGKLADRFNKRRLVFLGLLIFSVAGIFLGFSYGLAFILLGFIATVGDEMASISLWAWLNTLDKDHDEDGLISGVINLFQDLGWTIGPIVAGLLYSKIGPEWTITVGGLLILMAWLIYSIRFSGLHPYTEISMALIPKKPHRFRHKR
jgi:cyanate permease